MKKLMSLALVFLLTATAAWAHAGHLHTYMGTVTMLHGDGSFMIKTTDGKDLTVLTSKSTVYTHADEHPATPNELAVGMRVVVKMSKDGKTAASVKMSPAKR